MKEKPLYKGVIWRARADRLGTRHLWRGRRGKKTLCGVKQSYPGHPMAAGLPCVVNCKRCYCKPSDPPDPPDPLGVLRAFVP